jgi:hypothetical protein
VVILCYASLIAGEEERELKTDSFAMNVKADTAANLEGTTLARGAVRVPTGALAGARSDAVAAKVTTWADAGPLFYAKDWSPAGSNASKLRSPLLSVAFEAGGMEVEVANLSTGHPFVVTPAAPCHRCALLLSVKSPCYDTVHDTLY